MHESNKRRGSLIQSCPHWQDFPFVIFKGQHKTEPKDTRTVTLCQVSPLATLGKLQKHNSSQTQRTGEESFKGKMTGRKGAQKDDLQQNFPPFTRVKCYVEESGTWHSWRLPCSRLQLQKSKSHSATCQVLSIWLHSLSTILTRCYFWDNSPLIYRGR